MATAKRIVFRIDELDCAEEMRLLRRELSSTPGILQLDFNVVQGRMDVILDPNQISSTEVLQQIARLGMHGRPWQPRSHREAPSPETMRRRRLLSAGGMMLLIGFLLQVAHTGSVLAPFAPPSLSGDEPVHFGLSHLFYGLAILASLTPVAPRALAALGRRRADMNVLVCLAVGGALLLGEWLEGAMVSFLFGLALALEHWSLLRARRAISSLLELAPESAICRQGDNEWTSVALEAVPVGSRVRVQPGERIPLDGRILSGSAHVDQAPITGESMPVFKQPGDELFAGTLNGESQLEYQTTRTHEHSTLSRILQLVEEAQARKASGEQWIERFAGIYTPVMVWLALALALLPPLLGMTTLGESFYRALVLLLIACPCALVISTPVTFISALAAAARHGVLIKGGRFLEAAANWRVVVFDKTGTLTTGLPTIQQVIPAGNVPVERLLQWAARLELHVRHPLARAVVQHARQAGLDVEPLSHEVDLRLLAGRGIEARDGEDVYWLGGERLLRERVAERPGPLPAHVAQWLESGHSLIAMGRNDQLWGVMLAADTVRPSARSVIEQLRGLGVQSVWMLTGDQPAAARRVAEATGLDGFRAGLLPEEKVEQIASLVDQSGSVAMVGDGVNDSPALAAATVGVAMGAIGSDAALEAADVALMSDDLQRLPWLMRHSRRTLRVLRMNVALALGIKLIFVLLAALGYATLWSAIAADMGTSLLVIFLALQLRVPGPEDRLEPARRGARRRWFPWLAVGLAVVVGFSIAEAGLRVAGVHPMVDLYVPDPHCGSRLRPGYAGWFTSEGRAYIRINSAGHRDRERTVAKPDNTLRIAVLGDSFAEALQVPLEQTFWSQLEQRLSACPPRDHTNIEVLNFGVSGYGTGQALQMLRHYVWPYQPDIVLLAFYPGNDLQNNSSSLEPDRARPFFHLVDGRLELDESFHQDPIYLAARHYYGSWRYHLQRRFRLVQVARHLLRRGRTPGDTPNAVEVGAELGIADEPYRPPTRPEWQEAWEITDHLLQEMAEEVRAHGAEFHVAVVTRSAQVHPDPQVAQAVERRLGVSHLRYPEQRLELLGREFEFDVIGLSRPLAEYARDHQVFLHGFENAIPGEGHWNELGHQLAGEILAEHFCRAWRASSNRRAGQEQKNAHR